MFSVRAGNPDKERAAAGLLYDAAHNEEINRERDNCQRLCARYNKLNPGSRRRRERILRRILPGAGEDLTIEQPFRCDFGYHITIGDHFYANYHLVILDGAQVTIGDHVFLAPNCSIYAAGHPFDIALRNKGLEYAYPVTIRDNVWIGGNVTVIGGVTIGEGAVIAAGSIVTRDIPAHTLAAGNPCRVIRRITPGDDDKYR